MMHITFGEDTYGAVRRVERTTIVTKFFMLQMVPVYPLESYYLVRLGRNSGVGIPLLASMTQRQIVGLPCRRINLLSVFIAYIRALGAVMVVFPSIILMFGIIMRLCDANFRPDEFARLAATIAGIVLGLGLALTLPTYCLTFYVPSRERAIRRACARVLGIAADPAHVRQDVLPDIERRVAALLAERGITEPEAIFQSSNAFDRDVLDLAIVWMRARPGQGDAADARDSETDILLRAIEIVPE